MSRRRKVQIGHGFSILDCSLPTPSDSPSSYLLIPTGQLRTTRSHEADHFLHRHCRHCPRPGFWSPGLAKGLHQPRCEYMCCPDRLFPISRRLTFNLVLTSPVCQRTSAHQEPNGHLPMRLQPKQHLFVLLPELSSRAKILSLLQQRDIAEALASLCMPWQASIRPLHVTALILTVALICRAAFSFSFTTT